MPRDLNTIVARALTVSLIGCLHEPRSRVAGRDVDAWHAELRTRGAVVAEAPNDDLGFRNMTVMDPDGNQLRFMEPSRPQAEPGGAMQPALALVPPIPPPVIFSDAKMPFASSAALGAEVPPKMN